MTKTLGSFGINLNGNPTLGQILTQARGDPVEVAAPNPIVGTLLGVEKKTESVGEGSQHRVFEQEYINLLTEEGFRSLSLTNIQRIKLTNAALNAELNQALAILASNHDAQKKTVSITFDGTGNRQASRRLRDGNACLENILSTGLGRQQGTLSPRLGDRRKYDGAGLAQRDLSLVSGRPISFTMDLYQPLYNPRPIVQPELYANLRPQTYGDAMDELKPMAAPPVHNDMKKERLLGEMTQGAASGRANAPAEAGIAADIGLNSLEDSVAPTAMAEDQGRTV